MALGRTQTVWGLGCGEERSEPRQKMTRCVSQWGRKAKERKVDFAAQCQDPENYNPVFLLFLSKWGFFFLSRKMVDGTCLAAATSPALLQKCFPLHSSGQPMLENKWNGCPLNVMCRTRGDLYFYDHCGLACLCHSAGLRSGERGIIVVIIFFP